MIRTTRRSCFLVEGVASSLDLGHWYLDGPTLIGMSWGMPHLEYLSLGGAPLEPSLLCNVTCLKVGG